MEASRHDAKGRRALSSDQGYSFGIVGLRCEREPDSV